MGMMRCSSLNTQRPEELLHCNLQIGKSGFSARRNVPIYGYVGSCNTAVTDLTRDLPSQSHKFKW